MRKPLRTGVAALLFGICATYPALAQTVSSRPPSRGEVSLQADLEALVKRAAPGRLGVAVIDLRNGATWGVAENEAFPMMSVFKAPLAAAVLSEVDAGHLSLGRKITLTRKDLRKGASRIARNFRGERMSFTVGQLLTGVVSYSDNTAADALVRLVGGPQAITGFLRSHGIENMRVDLDERGIEHVFSGLGSAEAPPAGETQKERDARLKRGLRAFLDDPRNRSTPQAAALFLRKLWQGELLSPASTKHLVKLLYGQTFPPRLSAGLPKHVRLAHKSGTSVTRQGLTAAFNDIGILTWPDGHAVVVAAFLTASPASRDERNALFAELARTVVRDVQR